MTHTIRRLAREQDNTVLIRWLYPQDLECDVSVEDDNRQEWIFTLYDFDNSGKVTKEVGVYLS